MQDMIINPIWIYIIETIDTLHFSLYIAMAVSVMVLVVLFGEIPNDTEELAKIDKRIKRMCIAIITRC